MIITLCEKDLEKWDLRFYNLAKEISTWSKDPSTQVGAVIANRKNRLVSVGYNGFPAGVKDDIHNREMKILRTIHAEANAINFAKQELDDCVLYSTMMPCAHCAASIIQNGIKRVVCGNTSIDYLSRWADHCEEAESMFNEASVSLILVV